jgi:hypothetical protein
MKHAVEDWQNFWNALGVSEICNNSVGQNNEEISFNRCVASCDGIEQQLVRSGRDDAVEGAGGM